MNLVNEKCIEKKLKILEKSMAKALKQALHDMGDEARYLSFFSCPQKEINGLKMFLVFSGEDYYPCGGANDLVGCYSEEKKAIEMSKNIVHDTSNIWCHIYDTEKEKIIERFGATPHGESEE